MRNYIFVWRDPFNQNSTGKSGTPQKLFSKLFRLDRTDPLSFGPKFPDVWVPCLVTSRSALKNFSLLWTWNFAKTSAKFRLAFGVRLRAFERLEDNKGRNPANISGIQRCLKGILSTSDRYKTFASDWLWIRVCRNVVLTKIDITMTTINKKIGNW